VVFLVHAYNTSHRDRMAKLPMPSGASLEFLVSSATLRNKYESLIKTGSDPSKSKEAMGEIRQLIALEGIPPESDVRGTRAL
jgi:hypothetical protein